MSKKVFRNKLELKQEIQERVASNDLVGEAGIMMRKCVLSHKNYPRTQMVRFVISPQKMLVPDIAEKLPGRGIWVYLDSELLAQAQDEKLFRQRLRHKIILPEIPLLQLISQQMQERLTQLLGLMRRAGLAVQGLVKVEAGLRSSRPAILLCGGSASLQGQRKIIILADKQKVKIISNLPRNIGNDVFDRENSPYILLFCGGLCDKFIFLVEKWQKLAISSNTQAEA